MPAPGQFLPRRSGVHRIACIALYRALLSHCSKIPLPTDVPFPGPVNPVKYLVRKGFRKNVYQTSPRIAVERLKEGYEAEQLLRAAATGHADSISSIHELLRDRHDQAEHSRAITSPMPRPPPSITPYPGAPKVLDIRPLPLEKLSGGKRHVPTLAYTEYLPFLRFKRPQSPYLSRVLRQKLSQKQARMDLEDILEETIAHGEDEEEWEEALRFPFGMPERVGKEGIAGKVKKRDGAGEEKERRGRDGGVKVVYRESDFAGGMKGEKGERPWMMEAWTERGNIIRKVSGEIVKAQKLGVRMLGVVDKEMALAKEEGRERRRVKEQMKRRRKREEGVEWRSVVWGGGENN